MEQPVEIIEYHDYMIKVYQDDSTESSREWDNLGTIASWHTKYNLGDLQPKEDSQEFIANLPEGTVILPVYMYDHSGITINTTGFSCPWDSGQVGIIYCEPDKIRKEFGCQDITSEIKDKVIKCLIGEIETYDQYLTGDVYGFIISGDRKDSCWGFYGVEDCIAEAKSQIDYFVMKDLESIKFEQINFAL
jgi:hypothetical protein